MHMWTIFEVSVMKPVARKTDHNNDNDTRWIIPDYMGSLAFMPYKPF